ncbi:hypothetical protein ACLEPN_05020 [Myxococcus sp. 1LA]
MHASLRPLFARLAFVGCSGSPSDGSGEELPGPDGTTSTVPRLLTNRHRIGLTVTEDERLDNSYFGSNSNVNVGAIALLNWPTSPNDATGMESFTAGYAQRYDTAPLEDPGRRNSWLALARATVSVP